MRWLLGSTAPAGLGPQGEHVWLVSTIHAFLHFLASLDDGIDIVEICGGEARTSTPALRRHLRAGFNFDLVCNVDLNDTEHQAAVVHYFRHY